MQYQFTRQVQSTTYYTEKHYIRTRRPHWLRQIIVGQAYAKKQKKRCLVKKVTTVRLVQGSSRCLPLFQLQNYIGSLHFSSGYHTHRKDKVIFQSVDQIRLWQKSQ